MTQLYIPHAESIKKVGSLYSLIKDRGYDCKIREVRASSSWVVGQNDITFLETTFK
jgi:hypothetical protein